MNENFKKMRSTCTVKYKSFKNLILYDSKKRLSWGLLFSSIVFYLNCMSEQSRASQGLIYTTLFTSVTSDFWGRCYNLFSDLDRGWEGVKRRIWRWLCWKISLNLINYTQCTFWHFWHHQHQCTLRSHTHCVWNVVVQLTLSQTWGERWERWGERKEQRIERGCRESRLLTGLHWKLFLRIIVIQMGWNTLWLLKAVSPSFCHDSGFMGKWKYTQRKVEGSGQRVCATKDT